jgi:uncharacterized membrane protein YcaP (DUF421 family)
MSFTELSLRVLVTFFVLLILTRIMGRKEIAQLTFFNFVSAISIGTIAGALVSNENFSIREGTFALAGWAAITVIMGVLDIKSKKARLLVEGQPVIVIKNGQIMEDAMRKVRLDINSLNTMLRQNKVFSVTDVEYAIFETNGKLSVMKKEIKQTLTKQDMNIQKVNPDVFPISTEVISDGKVNMNNLSKLNLAEDWLEEQVKLAGAKSISDVFYAEVQKDGTLYIDKRGDNVH